MAPSNNLNQKNNKNIQNITFSNFLSHGSIKIKINQMVGGLDVKRFITSILGVVSNNPKITNYDKITVLTSALLGKTLNSSPSP